VKVRNIGQCIYLTKMMLRPRRQPSSYSSLRESQISHYIIYMASRHYIKRHSRFEAPIINGGCCVDKKSIAAVGNA
jgi:hypothetical protein